MKKIGFLMSLLFLCNMLSAQQMKEVFLNMPDSITPLLSAVNKADFIDFLDSEMKAQVKNALGGDSEMLTLTADYTEVQMSKNSSFEMKILPFKDDYLVGIIETVKGPVANSCLTLYNSKWEVLPTLDFITRPKATDFLKVAEFDNSTSDTKYIDLKGLDMSLIRYDFSADKPSLIATYTTPEYLNKEMQEQVSPFLNTSLSYVWDGLIFNPAK